MRIYLDIIFILNFLFDLILLFAVAIILRRQPSFKRLVLGALVGGISIFALFIPLSSFMLFLIKIGVSFLMVITTFSYRDKRYTMRNMFYLYTTSIILGGFLYLLNVEFSYKNDGLIFYHNGLSVNFITLIVLSPIIIYVYVKQIKELKNNYSKYYTVDIYLKDGTRKEVIGFLDTGNHLYDPYFNRPIILVNKKDFSFNYKDLKNIVLVPYETASSHGLLKCIVVDKIYIQGVGTKKNVLLGLSEKKIKIDGVDCLLHEALIEG